MILEIIGEEKPFWENQTFLLITYISLFIIFGITLLFILDSFIRRSQKHLRQRKLKYLLSMGTITSTYFILLIVFFSFLFLLCSEGICEFISSRINEIAILLAVIVANFGMIQRKSSRKSFHFFNYIFAAFNFIVSIYLVYLIFSAC